MYYMDGYSHEGLGVAQTVAIVGTAAANVGVNAYHAAKVSKLQQRFQKKLESDENKKQYIKFILLRLQSIAKRLGEGGKYRPGTDEFENVLKRVLKNDMNYRGNCNADIYYPLEPGEQAGRPRKVWATIDRTGYVKPGSPVPPDVGPIWATGCKNALDAAAQAYIERYKGQKRHEHFKTHKEDLGTLNLLLRAGTGIFMVIMLVVIIKVQRAVVKEQETPVRIRKKKKPQ